MPSIRFRTPKPPDMDADEAPVLEARSLVSQRIAAELDAVLSGFQAAGLLPQGVSVGFVVVKHAETNGTVSMCTPWRETLHFLETNGARGLAVAVQVVYDSCAAGPYQNSMRTEKGLAPGVPANPIIFSSLRMFWVWDGPSPASHAEHAVDSKLGGDHTTPTASSPM